MFFVDKAMGFIISCSRFESESDKEKVRKILLSPLMGEYSFTTEPNGVVAMSRIGHKRDLSPAHIDAYMERVFVEISDYKNIVDQNKAICKS